MIYFTIYFLQNMRELTVFGDDFIIWDFFSKKVPKVDLHFGPFSHGVLLKSFSAN